ncbi:MAG: DUF5655 domain-containing protein, partial [Phycisphaerales bacterium]
MTLYSPHPSLGMVQDWIAALKSKTGRDLDSWLAHINKAGPKDEKPRREWLKRTYALGTNTCAWLAERSVGKGADEDSPEAYLQAAEGYVEAMFAGKRAGLRPVYDAILRAALKTSPEVKACPGKTIVSLYRHHVFAQIRPATQSRIDLGFAF